MIGAISAAGSSVLRYVNVEITPRNPDIHAALVLLGHIDGRLFIEAPADYPGFDELTQRLQVLNSWDGYYVKISALPRRVYRGGRSYEIKESADYMVPPVTPVIPTVGNTNPETPTHSNGVQYKIQRVGTVCSFDSLDNETVDAEGYELGLLMSDYIRTGAAQDIISDPKTP